MVKIDKKQAPLLYIKLCRTLQALGELELAKATCVRGLARFPKDAGLHTLQGQILIGVYNKTKNQEDISGALSSFEQSLSLNPNNYFAAIMAVKIYLKGGMVPKAKEKLQLILSFSPGDEKATELLKSIEQKEAGKVRAKEVQSQDQARVKEEKTSLLFESEDEFMGAAAEIPDEEVAANYDALISNLTLFSRVDGLEAMLLCDKYGMVLKSVNKSNLDLNQLAIMISNIYRSSQNVMHRTKLGTFEHGLLMTPSEYFYVVNAGYAILTLMADPGADQKIIEKRISWFLKEISQ